MQEATTEAGWRALLAPRLMLTLCVLRTFCAWSFYPSRARGAVLAGVGAACCALAGPRRNLRFVKSEWLRNRLADLSNSDFSTDDGPSWLNGHEDGDANAWLSSAGVPPACFCPICSIETASTASYWNGRPVLMCWREFAPACWRPARSSSCVKSDWVRGWIARAP